MNLKLKKKFNREEIYEALQQMAPQKAPEPDGFILCFFESYRKIMGEDVCATILQFFNDRVLDDNINYTYIVLILIKIL